MSSSNRTIHAPGALHNLLFAPIPATAIAVLRIVVGLVTSLWAASLVGDVDPLLTEMRVDAQGDIGWWQVWPGSPATATVWMAVTLIVASLALAIGLWSRTTAWMVFGLTLALQRYNPMINNGGDFILRSVLLLGVALGPSGAYLSVDSFRRRGTFDWTAPKIEPWPIRFLQAHISLGYILTGVLKLTGETWLNGTAMWHALSLQDLMRFDLPHWLLSPPIGSVLGWTALLVEFSVGFGVWFRRTRPWVLLAGALLHLGIAAVMEIGFFSYVMLASYLAFLPDVDDVRKLIPRWRSRRAKDEAPVPVQP